eukprot:351171_1
MSAQPRGRGTVSRGRGRGRYNKWNRRGRGRGRGQGKGRHQGRERGRGSARGKGQSWDILASHPWSHAAVAFEKINDSQFIAFSREYPHRQFEQQIKIFALCETYHLYDCTKNEWQEVSMNLGEYVLEQRSGEKLLFAVDCINQKVYICSTYIKREDFIKYRGDWGDLKKDCPKTKGILEYSIADNEMKLITNIEAVHALLMIKNTLHCFCGYDLVLRKWNSSKGALETVHQFNTQIINYRHNQSVAMEATYVAKSDIVIIFTANAMYELNLQNNKLVQLNLPIQKVPRVTERQLRTIKVQLPQLKSGGTSRPLIMNDAFHLVGGYNHQAGHFSIDLNHLIPYYWKARKNDKKQQEKQIKNEPKRDDECKECDVWKQKYNELLEKYDTLKRIHQLDNTKYLNWDYDCIADWIIGLNVDEYKVYENQLRDSLKNEAVDGSCLYGLDKNDLHRLGITHFKHKLDIMKQIKHLIQSNQDSHTEGNTETIQI